MATRRAAPVPGQPPRPVPGRAAGAKRLKRELKWLHARFGPVRFLPGVTRVTARDIGIDGRAVAPPQGHGDLAGHLPVAIAIDPEPLEVIYRPIC